MAGWWIAWFVLAGDPAEPIAEAPVPRPEATGTSQAPGASFPSCSLMESVSAPSATRVSQQDPSLPTGSRLRAAILAALRRWDRPSGHELEPAARAFLGLYQALQRDRQLPPASHRFLQAKLRSRLAELAERIDQQVAAHANQASTPQTLAQLANRPNYLGQQRGPGGRSSGKGGGAGVRSGLGRRGTPSGQGPGGSTGATGPDVAGWQLAELIRQTIAPSTWDVRGGPGTLYYWSAGRALVVRQTTDVHEEIADLLDQLERQGR